MHLSRLIFINVSALNRDSDMVERLAVLISFNWLKLLSLSHEVIGRVNAMLAGQTLGNDKLLHSCRAPTKVSGTVVEHSFHFLAHKLYSVVSIMACGKSPLNKSTALVRSSGIPTSPRQTQSLGTIEVKQANCYTMRWVVNKPFLKLSNNM